MNYTLAGTDAAKFKIDRKTGQITTMEDLNYEASAGDADNCTAENACVVTVGATDASGDAATAATVNIEITDVNEKPMFSSTGSLMAITREENMTALAADADVVNVTYTATDPEGRSLTYHLMGPDASKFQLNASQVLSLQGEA